MKRQRSGAITLRYLTSIRVFFLIVAGLLVWGALSEFSTGSPLTKVAWAVVALVGIVAALEGLVGRIELRPDSLTIIGPFERRVYPRGEIRRFKAEWKVGLFVELVNYKWVKLETIGFMGRQAIPTLRAWLRDSTSGAEQNPRAAQQGDEADER